MLAITGATIYTMGSEGILDPGQILIADGKIKDIGKKIKIPEGSDILDVPGTVIMPGLIDAHTHLGIGEDGLGWEGRDYNEMTDPVSPHLRAIDAINPEDKGLQEAAKNGITSVMTGPGSANILGGENIVIKTRGNVVDQMVVRNPAGIKAAFGENPKRVYNNKKKTPSTRMAVAALLRQAFIEGQDYLMKKENYQKKEKPFKRDIKMESVIKVLNKEIPLRAHAHRADDILTILRIAREFDIDVTLEHCTEGHRIASEIARAGVPAVIGPTLTGRTKVELKRKTFRTPAVLSEAGVKVAIMSDHPVIPVDNLPVYAGLAVKAGMDRMEALRAITINAAEILGVADRIGSLDKGKDADLVIFDGDPLQIQTGVEKVFINGKKVD